MESSIPELTFDAWWRCVGVWQGPPLAVAAALGGVIYYITRKRTAATLAGKIWIDLRILWFALLAAGASLCAAILIRITIIPNVHPFFFGAGVAFWLFTVTMPLILIFRTLLSRNSNIIDRARAVVPAALLALGVYMLFGEPTRVAIVRETIVVPTLPAGAEIKIAHMSDIQTVGVAGRELYAKNAVNEFDPDIVAITGDLTASGQHPLIVEQLNVWMQQLKTKTSIYLVNGDSDPDFDELVTHFNNVTYLKDSGTTVDVRGAKLYIGGMDNRAEQPDGSRCFRDAPPGIVKIAIAHNPDYFCYAPNWRAEVGLAGHTHGGQIQIPGFGALVTFTTLGRRYAEGVFRSDDLDPNYKWGIDSISICPGLGMEGCYAPRVRLFCPPKVFLLTLKGPAARER